MSPWIPLIIAIITGLYAWWIIDGPSDDFLEDIYVFYPPWVETAFGIAGLACLVICPVATITTIVLAIRA